MPSKVWTIFDSRLSNIFTFLSSPPEANIFPSLWHTSIQKVISSIRNEDQIKQESPKYISSERKIIRLILFFPNERRRGKIKNLLYLPSPSDSIWIGFFKMRTFFSASRILRSLRSYLTYNSGSSELVLHLQRPV